MMLNKVSLNTIGLNRIGLNRIGKPSRASSDRPYIDPEVLASLKAVFIVGNKTNNDSDRAIVKNLVDPDNPFVISNAAYTEGSGYADKGSPYYGAFVTDGIDDLITSTKTVQEMGITDEVTVVSMIHQIDLNSTYTIATTNYIENSNSKEHVRSDVYNYGKTGIYGYSASLINNTKSDIKNILGDEADYYVKSNNSLQTIFDAKFSVVGRISELIEASQLAWYWTIIANKVLTTDEINQVIAYFNLDRTLKPDILCDVKKQGITNDNHAEFGDKLIDFSGNGRDIQLNNIAWKLDSGIGKYETDLSDTRIWTRSKEITSSPFSFSYNGLSGWILFANTELTNSTDIPSFKIPIKGLLEGQELIYRYYDSNGQSNVYSMGKDGEYTLPSDVRTAKPQTSNISGFQVVKNEANIITITQIPSHAGSLCLDGVNDFGKVTGMPVYKDYTVVADYERLKINIGTDSDAPILSKSESTTNGAFMLNTLSAVGEKVSYSFGARNVILADDTERGIFYQSRYVNNGETILSGGFIDSDKLWLGTYRDNDSRFFNGAIYSLMSFPYSMSEFLIERQLKKHKLGTLYPDMVEWRPIYTSNVNDYTITKATYFGEAGQRDLDLGNHYPIGTRFIIYVKPSGAVDEVTSIKVNGVELTYDYIDSNYGYAFNGTLSSKSPQKINITIDEYIRYEDIVQPYPSLFTLIDYDTEEVYSWGSKLKVGARFKGNVVNLLPNMYEWQGNVLYNGEVLNWNINPGVVAKEMVFSWNMPFKYLIDNNEPKCILSPRLLRIPNSSYKILGYIPDISGHGNNGVIHNSAYAEGSGVNEDGSYQLDGVDDFVTIPTIAGKQVLIKLNWQNKAIGNLIYDQRDNGSTTSFAIMPISINDTTNNKIAYQIKNANGITYIDGIRNEYIESYSLENIIHNITITNPDVSNKTVALGASNRTTADYFAKYALYDFMLFDNISTDDKIKELNEYVGIEAKVELPPYYWDAYGKTNLDADKATIQQRGVAIGDYDLTNNNLAYDKMSGFGGYTLGKFTNSWSLSNNSNSISIVSRNPYDITLKKLGENSDWEFNTTELKIISNPVSVKFKSDKNIRFKCDYHYYTVGGNSEGAHLGITSKDLIANEDTIITISPISQENIDKYNIDINRGYYLIYFQLSPTLAVNEEVTIEMLPLYPNGLVLDGVNDHLINENIPAFTDYTYIIKRTILSIPYNATTLLKGAHKQNGGAFIADYGNKWQFNFGQYNTIQPVQGLSWATKNSYNGTAITTGTNTDDAGITVGKFSNGYAQMVFYKLMLYPKTITNLEIMFLKNMFERDEIIDLTNPIFIQE